MTLTREGEKILEEFEIEIDTENKKKSYKRKLKNVMTQENKEMKRNSNGTNEVGYDKNFKGEFEL